MPDEIEIEVLPDGTIKATTGRISQQNHMNAEAFMRHLATAGGGKQERRHRHGVIGAAIHAIQHATGKSH